MKLRYFDLGLYDGKEIDMFLDEIKDLDIAYEVHGFEAHPDYATEIHNRFKDNPNVHIYFDAIGPTYEMTKLYLEKSGHGNSLYKDKNNVDPDKSIYVNAVPFDGWLDKNFPDLTATTNILRFNIEGAEWLLINQLIQSGYTDQFDLYLGSVPGSDLLKVESLKNHYHDYLNLLKEHDITIHPYCAEHANYDIFPDNVSIRELLRL